MIIDTNEKAPARRGRKPGKAPSAPTQPLQSGGPASISPFNPQGIIEQPSFVLKRPEASEEIDFMVRAHSIAQDCWIAEPAWKAKGRNHHSHDEMPGRHSKVFKTLSEAVDDACSRGIRQIKNALGANQDDFKWQKRLNALCAWASTSIREARSQDQALPLKGCTVIDLACGGFGGFGMALTSLGATVTLACDIDRKARAVYAANVAPLKMHDDLQTLKGTGLECDILTLGLMCQPFSRAGVQLGRNHMVHRRSIEECMRLLKEVQAKVVVLGFVRNLLKANGGQDAKRLHETLEQAGYFVQQKVLNTKGFGLPQDRERVFWVAIKPGTGTSDGSSYTFPVEKAWSAIVQDIMDQHIPAKLSGARITDRQEEPSSNRGNLVQVGLIDGRDAQGYRVYSTKGLGATLTATGGGHGQTSIYAVEGGARPLTPREACRMQGLPEWAIHARHKTVAYRHIGNGVAIPLVRELMLPLARILKGASTPVGTALAEGGAA